MKKVSISLILLIHLVLPGMAYPAGSVVEEGRLTAIEDGEFIIDDKGYLLSPEAVVMDEMDRRIPVEELHIPGRVLFEYTYTPRGPMIIRIREVPEVVPE